MPPINDNVADAIQLTGTGGTVTGDNTGATSESPNELTWKGANVPTVWYYFHNTSGTSVDITVGTLRVPAVGSWGNGPDLELWIIPTLPADYSALNPGAAGTYWAYYIGDTVDFSASNTSTTITVPDGSYLFFEVGNWYYNDTDFGAFSFNWVNPVIVTGNDNFANAYNLATSSGSLVGNNTGATTETNDPLGAYYGSQTVWFKLPASASWRQITIALDLNGGNIFPVMGLYLGSSLATLYQVAFAQYNNADIVATLPAGQDHYIEVTGNNNSYVGTFALTWAIVGVVSPPLPDAPGPAIELKSPSSPYTVFPGNAIAVRVSDYMSAARGTLTSVADATAPSGTYVADTQFVTGITADNASYYSTTIANSAANTISVHFPSIGAEVNIRYLVYALVKTVGVTPNTVAKYSEYFHKRTSARIYYDFNNTGYWSYTNDIPNNSEHQWMYVTVNSFVVQTTASDYTLRLRAFSINSAGVEVRIAQIVLIPIGIQGVTTPLWKNTDFSPYKYLYNFTYGPDVAAGYSLGSMTVEGLTDLGYNGEPYQGILSPQKTFLDHQTSPTEYEVTDVKPDQWESYYISRLWTITGAVWYPLTVVEEDDFSRILPPVAGYHYTIGDTDPTFGDYTRGFGDSPYGYQWYTQPLYGESSHEWGYDDFYSLGEQKAWIEVDGSAAVVYCGGWDNGIKGIRANLGKTNPYQDVGPSMRDIVDYVIEGSFSTVGTLDSTVFAEIGKIGKGVQTYDGCTCLIVEWQPDGSLQTRLEVQSSNVPGNTDNDFTAGSASVYVISGPTTFSAGPYTGAKIRMKLQRLRYTIRGKVWYDSDAEPAGWTHQGYMPGLITTTGNYSGPFDFLPYPYTPIVGQYVRATGWSSTFNDDGSPFFSSRCAWPNVVPTDNGGQHTRVAFKWDNFKVTYDPGGDVVKDAHFKMKSGATDWVTDTTIPRGRQAMLYCGKRLWGTDGAEAGQSVTTWVDSGAAPTMGAFGTSAFWRKVLYEIEIEYGAVGIYQRAW